MEKLDPLKFLECQLDIDFEHEAFPVVIEKLAASGMNTFRLNWQPDVTICMAFDEDACKMLNDALDGYLVKLENSV